MSACTNTTARSATPIANAIKARINRGEDDAYWVNDLTGPLVIAMTRNEIDINPALTDSYIMRLRTQYHMVAYSRKEQVTWKP